MINLGILGCSEIAGRRFLPAARKAEGIRVVAVAEEYDRTKLKPFSEQFGIETEENFASLIARDDIDAVYIPQPPALHHKWARIALEHNKHVLVEKPSTTCLADTRDLTVLAEERCLALHENYMFQYHSQFAGIRELLREGAVGSIRLIRAEFGFPLRPGNDFRYARELGGGALLDAGGYPIRLAALLLGDSVKVDAASLQGAPGYEVELYGSALLSNRDGLTCQIGFGMDCAYRCSLEIWGSRGYLSADRVFTAPPEYEPAIRIQTNEGPREIHAEADDQFLHSLECFCREISDSEEREKSYRDILIQAKLSDAVRSKAGFE